MKDSLQQHADKLRFALVGGVNTLIDFSILFVLVNLGLDKIPSNYISTSVAFVFSFFANKTFTFKSTTGNAKREFILFLIITLFGLWVLQPAVIYLLSSAMASLKLDEQMVLLITKIVATLVSLIWNYIMYSRFVFKKEVQS
ncbi:MAG TPA: GtrA family protein [Candidatus Saccharimonadales bacterium]